MLLDQFSEPESLVEFAHQNQAAVGSDARALEIDLERGVEGELKGLLGTWIPFALIFAATYLTGRFTMSKSSPEIQSK